MKWTRYVFLIFLAVSFLTFLPSIGAGFVYDFLGWQKEYSQGSFIDIVDSFGYNGNHQFLHFVFYTFYRIFYIQGFPWFLFFSSLHAVNAYLLYRLLLKLSGQWGLKVTPTLAFIGALIFLIHPYSVEAVVWKVCVHYLISLMAVLSILILYLRHLEKNDKRSLIAGGIIYLISLFSLEISFITPVMVSLAALITWWISDHKKLIFKKSLAFAGSLWGWLGAYLLFNKITLGTIVGHYGGDVHLKLDFLIVASTEIKYFVKHLFFARFYSFHTKAKLFDQFLSIPEITFAGVCILIALVLWYFIKIRQANRKWHFVAFGVLASLLYVFPIANIYFMHLHIGMNDRYSYIPIAFLLLAITGLVSNFQKWLRYSILGLIFLLSIFFQQKTMRYWNSSTKVLQSLKADFRWHEAPYVFILNSPDNFKGIVMASIINEPSGIDELIDYQTKVPYDGNMYDVFQFNMSEKHEGVKVEQTGPMQLKVTFNQWGNWWHRNGIGGSSYENEFYKAETLDYPYQITFKQFPEGSVIIYQDEMKWKEFKWE